MSSYCLACGAGIDEYDSAYYARNMLCISCFDRKAEQLEMVSCGRCGTRVRHDEAKERSGGRMCGYCASEIDRMEKTPLCPICRKTIEGWQKPFRMANGQIVHQECASSSQGSGKRAEAFCSVCGKKVDFFKITGGRAVCARCDAAGASASDYNHPILESLMGRIGSMLG